MNDTKTWLDFKKVFKMMSFLVLRQRYIESTWILWLNLPNPQFRSWTPLS